MPENLFCKSGYGLSVKLNINCNKTNNPAKNYGVIVCDFTQQVCRIAANVAAVALPLSFCL